MVSFVKECDWTMKYFISYKGKPYGSAMARGEAEAKLVQLSKSFDGLEVIPVSTVSNVNNIPIANSQASTSTVMNAMYKKELPSS